MSTVNNFGAALRAFNRLSLNSYRCNCYRSAITKTSRQHYVYTFPTRLVFPDGSTLEIKYKEPRQIIKLPVDTANLTENERKQRLMARKGAKIVQKSQKIDVDFNADDYSFLWSNNKS
uniref:39S ribosomal protein L55, mitochondrial n=1 Tax=Romanomermis culicivorax TaxID=13658 RepID=A0A915K850_ROMCU